MEILKFKKFILKGRGVGNTVAEGKALVSQFRISALGGIDPKTGLIMEKDRKIRGKSVKDKVLVFPSGKGSDTWGGILYDTCRKGNGPVAIVNHKVDSFVINGIILTKIPMVVIFEPDPCKFIKSGDFVKVDAKKGIVEVQRKIKMDNIWQPEC